MKEFIESNYGIPLIFFMIGEGFMITNLQSLGGLGFVIMAGCIRIAWAIEYK